MSTGFRRIWWYPPLPIGARVFEIGYGAGHFQLAGRTRGWIMSGCDPGCQPPNGACLQVSAERLTWPHHQYDAVVAWQVLEHLVDPTAVLHLARRALAPGGYLVASVPNRRSLERWVMGDRWDGWRLDEEGYGRHRWHWDTRTFPALLRSCGFRVQKVMGQRQVKHLPGGIVTGTLLAALGFASRITVVARA